MSAGAPPPGPPPSAPLVESSSSPSQSTSWEGDRMFNIYIYDYCTKRGFRKTARELLNEADITAENRPPIDAKQGLLFEWWSVFWVLFTAKSNGTGPEDALIYTQHQAHQAAQRQLHQRMPPQPMHRAANGMGLRPSGPMTNGPLPNGVGPTHMQGVPLAGSMGSIPGLGPQPNGMPGPSGLPSALGPAAAQSPNYPQSMPGQRPGMPPQRNPNGVAPFQSPMFLAVSPQNSGLDTSQQAPMGQLGPSPHMAHMNRNVMFPPNGPQGMSNPNQMNPGQQVQTPGAYQQRPPSRLGSPSSNTSITHRSPSLAARQTAMSADITNEILRLPANMLNSIKQEVGLSDKDINALTLEDKQHIVQASRQRNRAGAKPAQANNTAGPSSGNQLMQPPNSRANSMSQMNPQTRITKRSSTSSPGDEPESVPMGDTSPPDRKRARRSPMDQQQQQQQAQQPQQPMTPLSQSHTAAMQGGQAQNGLMRPPIPGPMNGFTPQGMPYMGNTPGMNMSMGQGMGPQAPHTMSPAMTHPNAGIMSAQAHYGAAQRYHPSTQNMSKPGSVGNLPGNVGSPASSDPSFNTGGQPGQIAGFSGSGNRLSQNNKPMTMMPPPSPGMNAPKDQAGPKDKQAPPPEGSPRNVAQPTGQAQGQTTPTPSTLLVQSAPAPNTPGPSAMTAPSPSSVLNSSGPPLSAPGSAPNVDLSDIFPVFPDDYVDSSLFHPAGDFERDFGQWFHADGNANVLDMK